MVPHGAGNQWKSWNHRQMSGQDYDLLTLQKQPHFGAAQPRLVRQEPSEAMKLPMLPAAAIRVSWVD